MRAGVLLAVLLFLDGGTRATAQPRERTFGSGVGEGEIVSVLELVSDPAAYLGKRVRVTGRIRGVCPRRGCWIEIAGDDARTIRFKVEDGVIVFPADVEGQRVVAEGVVVKHELSREQAVDRARHLAEERGEEFDPSSVGGPLTLYEIQGGGAVVRAGS